MKNKISEIEALTKISNNKIDVIVVAESWIKIHEEKYVNISNYDLYNCGRNDRIGGGSAIFVYKELKSKVVSSFCDDKNSILVVEIDREGEKLNIVSLYRPPGYRKAEIEVLLNILKKRV